MYTQFKCIFLLIKIYSSGQQLASQMANTNPSLVENLRRSFTENPSTSNSGPAQDGGSDTDKANKKPEP